MSIKISPKHGVNPSVVKCYWCGGDKNELALFGRLPGDEEAPMRAVINYDPCDKCREQWEQGITFIGVTYSPNSKDQPPIARYPDGTQLFPTHDLLCVKEGAIEGLLPGDELAPMREQILSMRKAYIEQPVIKEWLDAYQNTTEQETSEKTEGEQP